MNIITSEIISTPSCFRTRINEMSRNSDNRFCEVNRIDSAEREELFKGTACSSGRL